MIKTFESLNELYAFFVPNLIKPPCKPSWMFEGFQLDRSGCHINIYYRPTDYSFHMWFYSHPNRDPTWVAFYDKFTNSSQES